MTETLLECRDVYWRFAGQCTQCGHCMQACSSLTSAGMSLGEIAKAMLKAEREAGNKDELAVNLAMDP